MENCSSNRRKRLNHECLFCKKRFPVPAILEQHIAVHTKEKPYFCKFCPKEMFCKQSLLAHTERHERKCPICETKLFKTHDYNRHLKLHLHGGKPHECEQCGKRFRTLWERKSHLLSHTKEKRFNCQLCLNDSGRITKFAGKSTLNAHLLMFHDDLSAKRYLECLFCLKREANESSLDKHIRKHTKERPFFCNLCPFESASNQNLKHHLETHQSTKSESHKCELCGKGFPRSGGLLNHLRNHTNERPFKCSTCPKSFPIMSSLKLHEAIHLGVKKHVCEICRKGFVQFSHLRRHMMSHTGEKPHSCPHCPKSFSRKELLRLHLRTHTGEKPYFCDICSNRFSQRGHLRVHLQTFHAQ